MFKERVLKISNALDLGEALLITSEHNRLYFTGFHSSAGMVLITKNGGNFFIDFRYFEKAKATVDSCNVVLSQRTFSEIFDLLKKQGINKLYLETRTVSISEFSTIKETFEGVEILNSDKFDNLIEEMRSVKTQREVELIKKAQKLTDDTFNYILDRIKVGRSEIEVMLDMEFFMRSQGSEGVSFDFIVVSGKNSSLPHGVPTKKLIENGDFITMDFGAVVSGYHSDMTRTVAVGNISDEQIKVYETVLKAQDESLKAIKPGVVCKDIDKIARDIIYGAGYEGCFGHGLGHSVGIEIHENPNFNMRCDKILKQGTIMTVEPGIYLENRFGVRIEDMVYVTNDGIENLTKSDKTLITL